MSTGGRPRLSVGQVGRISIKRLGNTYEASGSTRDASGALRRIAMRGDSELAAREAVIARAAELGLAHGALGPAATLADLIAKFVREDVEHRRIEESTKAMYAVKTRRLIRAYGAIPVRDLSGGRLRNVLLDLRDHCTAAEFTVVRSVLKQVLEFAVLSGHLEYNALRMMASVRAPESESGKRALTPEQANVLLSAFRAYADEGRRRSNRRQSYLAVAVILGVGGLRVSEALAIRQGDIDFENSTVHICGILSTSKELGLHRKPKRKRKGQERLVRLEPRGLAMRAFRAAFDELPTQHRAPNLPIIHRVDPDGVAVWVNAAIVREHLEVVRERPEVVAALATTGMAPKELTPHTLRRTVATVLSRNFGDETAQDVLAHEDKRTTKVYIESSVREADARVIDAAFGFDQVVVS